MKTTPTTQLSAQGVSIWLDDLSRERITSGNLAELISQKNVVGVTTNPSIFAASLNHGAAYAEQISSLARAGKSVDEAVFEITTDDVRQASDIFLPLFEKTDGFDGRVSIEVEPDLAHDAEGTINQAKKLFDSINRPNVLIKIPATIEGLSAITATIAAGISVNVTLIFSLERYREVINAYLSGLEKAKEAGLDLSKIHSVASFFVSRVDTEVDKRLRKVGTEDALALTGKAGIANAQLAYEIYQQAFSTERSRYLLAAGANKQRPLWASTGVKDPSLSDTAYVVELIAPEVVNTMPEKTLSALYDHGVISGNSIVDNYQKAHRVLDDIAAQGISYAEVTELLEKEGVEKFIVSWNELLHTVVTALDGAK